MFNLTEFTKYIFTINSQSDILKTLSLSTC